ncbi:MAG: HAD hydrolase family protein [Melioribacter sp.]|nr:HAD hydrolase family protein [Melioribacter sp.]
MKNDLSVILKDIKLFLFDLDGVLVHNKNLTVQQVVEIIQDIKKFSEELSSSGLMFGIVTARKQDELITELGKIEKIFLISSTLEKVQAVDKLLNRISLNYKNVFYAGDEVLDLPLLAKVGLSAAPSWAKREVKRSVKYVLKGTSINSILNEILVLVKNVRK